MKLHWKIGWVLLMVTVAALAAFGVTKAVLHYTGEKTKQQGDKVIDNGKGPRAARNKYHPPGDKKASPVETIKEYYYAIKAKDLEAACKLQADCPNLHTTFLLSFSAVEVIEIRERTNNGNIATIRSKTILMEDGKEKGKTVRDWKLRHYPNGWIIFDTELVVRLIEKDYGIPTNKPQPKLIIDKDVAGQAANAVMNFYNAVGSGSCEKALKIRPSYKRRSCREVGNTKVHAAEEIYNHHGQAVVYIEISYDKGGVQRDWQGHVKLVSEQGQWLIKTYRSEMSAREFIKKYVDYESFLPKNKKSSAASMEDQSFGSMAVLRSCWSPGELEGQPSDARIIKPDPHPYTRPPAREKPKNQAAALPDQLHGSIRSVSPPPRKKPVALTFDLCERTKEKTGYDREIFNYLRNNNIKATFYAGGKWMHSHPEKAKQIMADPRFEVGNHAWTHGNLRVIKGREMRNQVDYTQAQYELLWEELAGQECAINAGYKEMLEIPRIPLTFRFPYGTCNDESLSYLAKQGLPAIQWNVVTGDPYHKQTASGIANIVLRKAKPGSIIIMHANCRGHGTAEALPMFVPKLKERGFSFVTVSELLRYGKPFVVDECYEKKSEDNLHYDKIFGKGT